MSQALQLAEQDQILERRKVVVNADAVSQIADGAVDPNLALRRPRQIRQNAQHSGLASAVPPQQRET
jgi:hypothetical protein